ncbi:hypothetical protein HDU93_006722 [Gonapodya sp. JEL0774]|nr:hypothetical protein HDU93_006722 [Gonapodya sp. JEL0774]
MAVTFRSTLPPPDLKSRISESYDAIAPAYNSWTKQHHPLREKYLDLLFEFCPTLKLSESAVLELGCGAGIPTLNKILSCNPSLQATGIDLSSKQIALARENLAPYVEEKRLTLRVADMADLSFPHESLDAVVALWSIIHIPQGEQIDTLKRIGQWLKPGGCFLANFAAGEGTEGVVMENWLGDKGWMFWSGLGEERTKTAVADAGLNLILAETAGDQTDKFLWVIARKV